MASKNGGNGSRPINSATSSNAVASLDGLFKYSGTDAGLLAVFNPAAALGSTAAANSAGAQLSPAAVFNAAAQASGAAALAVFNVATAHVDGLRTAQAGGNSGVATGESANNSAAGVMSIKIPVCNRAPALRQTAQAQPALRHRAQHRSPIPAYWPWA